MSMPRVLNPLRYILPAVQQVWSGTSTVYAPSSGTPGKKDIVDFDSLKKKSLTQSLSLTASQPHSVGSHLPLPQVIRQ